MPFVARLLTAARRWFATGLFAVVAACVVGGAPAQAAGPRHHDRRPATSRRHRRPGAAAVRRHRRGGRRRHHRRHRRGRAAALRSAPTAQARARALSQITGLDPSQVVAKDVCGAPRPNHVQCAAQAIHLRSDGRLVHPAAQPGPSFTQVFPRAAAGIQPQSAPAGSGPPSPGTPAYLQQAYDLSYLSQTQGGGDTVAIVDVGDDPTAESDLATYRSTFGLPACTTSNGCFRKVNQNGAASPLPAANSGWEGEISLDLDAVSALCPNCHIILVEASTNSFSDMDQADIEGAAMGANQISDSWSGGVSGTFGGTYTFAHAAVIAATGDNGYLDPSVDAYPAALPGVTAAGGTTLAAGSGAGAAARGFSEAAWSGAGSGCDTYESKPAYQTDSGCTGRSWADLAADADPNTGLVIRDNGSWYLYGGTSLATPLVAAFEAVSGVSTTTPQWPYTDSSLLNDPSSGSTGSCAASISYICNARAGYDGPTGMGSISGAITTGGPGIAGPVFSGGYAQTVDATDATLTGGVYPNGLATTYYWQYGPTTSYGQQTTAGSAGSGQAPQVVSTSLSGLSAATTYHYRLVAANSAGTTYGYDYTFSTPSLVPAATARPAISGAAVQGATLTLTSDGTWSPAATSYTDQWQIATSPTSGWQDVTGATATSYTVPAAGLGASYRSCVTAANTYGTGFKCSDPVGPIASAAPAYVTQPTISGNALVGATLTATSPGTWNPAATSYSYQWQIATSPTSGWQDVTGATTTSYTIPAAGLGATYRACVTAANTYGTGFKCAIGIGPIASGAPAAVTRPTVTGTGAVGATLTETSDGTWSPAATSYSYQWQIATSPTSGWQDVIGATTTSYTIPAAGLGATYRICLTATNAYGTGFKCSDPVGPIVSGAPAAVSRPTITGTGVVGATLSLTSNGTWSPAATSYAGQWQIATSPTSGWQDVTGATTTSYTIPAAGLGASYRICLTATNTYGTGFKCSDPVGPIGP